MIDRDPFTEPAGDMMAAQTLIEVLSWIEQGGDARLEELSARLLHWKGHRLREALGDTSFNQLQRHIDAIAPDSDDAKLLRLAAAAGLLLNGDDLHEFILAMTETHHNKAADLRKRTEALSPLMRLLPRRHERTLLSVSLSLIEVRDTLPATAARLSQDAALVEHLFCASPGHRAVTQTLSDWLVRNAHYTSADKHKTTRHAILTERWDVVDAFFFHGAFGISGTDAERQLISHLNQRHPRRLVQLTDAVMTNLERPKGDPFALSWWLLALLRHLDAHLTSSGAAQRAFVLRVHKLAPEHLRFERSSDMDTWHRITAALMGRLGHQT